MKRIIRPLFLMAILASLLCVSAFAMDYEKEEGHPIAANGERVSYTAAGTVTVRGDDNEKFNVTATGVTSGEQYLLLVLKKEAGAAEFAAPTQSNIIYIDQAQATDSSITFTDVFPTEIAAGEQYEVHVVGTNKAYDTSKATFSYDYVTFTLGDVDEDNVVATAGDSSKILQYNAGNTTLSDTQLVAADVDGDGVITTGDSSYILQYTVSNYDDFSVFLNAKKAS